jgi:hypothetical protein
MKKAKFIICLILSISLGIAATTPLLRAELTAKPWVTHIQGPNAPFNVEVVYANFTITDPDLPITQTSGPTIEYNIVVNVTNPSEYRARLSNTYLTAAQNVQSITSKTPLIDFFNNTSTFESGEAKGAWVDGVYYNVTLTIPYPYSNEGDTNYHQWKEGVQYYKHTIKDDTGTNTYTYLNMDGTWVDVTGRVIIDETEPEYKTIYTATGPAIIRHVFYASSGTDMSKDSEFNCFFAPGESRLLVISGSSVLRSNWVVGGLGLIYVAGDLTENEGYINPVDIIQSGIIQMLTQVETFVDLDPIGENNTFIDMTAKTAEVQELTLTRVGNSYIYNTILSGNQMFQLDRYGLEVFIVPVE